MKNDCLGFHEAQSRWLMDIVRQVNTKASRSFQLSRCSSFQAKFPQVFRCKQTSWPATRQTLSIWQCTTPIQPRRTARPRSGSSSNSASFLSSWRGKNRMFLLAIFACHRTEWNEQTFQVIQEYGWDTEPRSSQAIGTHGIGAIVPIEPSPFSKANSSWSVLINLGCMDVWNEWINTIAAPHLLPHWIVVTLMAWAWVCFLSFFFFSLTCSMLMQSEHFWLDERGPSN